MNKFSLSEFASKISEKNRVTFADLQRLQRDFLPDGIGSRDDAELLIGLDRDIARADAGWSRFLVSAIVDFVVWGERPTGIVKEETAQWLAAALAGDGGVPSPRSARLIAREIAEEAQAFENNALADLAAAFPEVKARGADLPAGAVALAA